MRPCVAVCPVMDPPRNAAEARRGRPGGGRRERTVHVVPFEPSNPSAGGQPTPGVRAQTRPAKAWLANRIVRGLRRTPSVCRVVGNRLIAVYDVGAGGDRPMVKSSARQSRCWAAAPVAVLGWKR
jgi:hypothetical protein